MAKVVKRSDFSKKDYSVDAGILRVKDSVFNITSDIGDGSRADFNEIDPLLYWAAPSNPKTGAVAHVLFNDGLGYYTFNGLLWVLNFFYPSSSYIPGGPKRYKALLSQLSTSIPTSVILENTFTSGITFSYVAPGLYQVNSLGSEFSAKTSVIIGSNNNASFSSSITYNTFNITTVGFMLATFDATTLTNGILEDTLILIEVYP